MNYELIMNYERIAKSPNEIEEISTYVLFFIIYWVVSFVLAAGYRAYLPAPYLDVLDIASLPPYRRGGGAKITKMMRFLRKLQKKRGNLAFFKKKS